MPFTKGHKIFLGRKHTKESIAKMSISKSGTKMSASAKLKMSQAKKALGIVPPSRKGIKMSLEGRKNMSLARKGKLRPDLQGRIPYNKGQKGVFKHSLESKKKMSNLRKGDKSHLWKGGITKENAKIRNSFEYRIWREAVFKRDNWTCIWCLRRGVELNADHIKPFAYYPELRFAIDNGRTLCKECHKKTDTFAAKVLKAYQTII